MAVDGRNLVIYNRNRFERGIALGAWKQRLAVLNQWCVDILVTTRITDMLFVRCEPELSYSRRLRDATGINVEVVDGVPKLKCWFSGKLYTNMYLMRGDTHLAWIMELENCQRNAVLDPIFVGLHNLKNFAFCLKNRFCHCVTVFAFW